MHREDAFGVFLSGWADQNFFIPLSFQVWPVNPGLIA